jgi:hypothetical protein
MPAIQDITQVNILELLPLLKLSVVFASLASRDSLDSITEGQLSTSSRGNTILKRASSALRASGTWRSSSMLTCVISWKNFNCIKSISFNHFRKNILAFK